jgi:glycosyltransferase involved in cell wall biosynthesis
VAQKEEPPVSIIVCARNEAANLRKNLGKLLAQHYPVFELIVVDDTSEDESLLVLEEFKTKNPHLQVIKKEIKESSGKKAALALGIASAKYEWLLLCDADCEPASEAWIAGMMAARSKAETKIVLGFAPYHHYPEWVNRWIRFETCYTALQYFSAAAWKIPYMGVGRNMLYHKSLYKKYSHILTTEKGLASGDDDLFINAAADAQNTEFCLDPKTFVFSEPKRSFSALYKQKTRHYSTGTSYKLMHQILLGALSLSHTAFWILLPFALIKAPCLVSLFFFIRILSIFMVWSKILRIFGDEKLRNYVVFFDFLVPFYYFIFAQALFFKNRSQWK